MSNASALLRSLRELAPGGEAVPLTRLAKRLDARVSVLLREAALLGEAPVGGERGPGWVALDCDDAGRWTIRLTPAGQAQG
jgi:fermentation-respiration switch protein FrsA (DUF1100 family)